MKGKKMSLLPKSRGTREDIIRTLKKSNSRSEILIPTISLSGSKKDSLMDRINSINSTVIKEFKNEEDNYELITDEDVLANYIDVANNNGELVIDTETSSLEPITCIMAGSCFYTPELKPAYVPINHISYVSGIKVEGQLPADKLKRQLLRMNREIKLIFHNAKFDIRVVLNQLGIDLFPYLYFDTMVASSLLNENESHGLKYLYSTYCDPDGKSSKYSELFNDIPFPYIPIKTGYLYAARDAKMTYDLYKFQQPFLDYNSEVCKEKGLIEVAKYYEDIELPAVGSLIEMEENGVHIDLDFSEKLLSDFENELKKREKVFRDACKPYEKEIKKYRLQKGVNCKLSDPILISSPTQISKLLYEVIEIEPVDSRDTKGTGVAILEKIKEIYKEDDKDLVNIVKAVLDYRHIDKLITTYVKKLPKLINKKTGKLHTTFKQHNVVTGRLASEDPNLQNIPTRQKGEVNYGEKVRMMFVAGNENDEEMVMLFPDYSQQEPRLLSIFSGDEGLIRTYKEGKDVYAFMGTVIDKVPYEDCLEKYSDGTANKEGKKRRYKMKQITLSIMYEKSAPSLAETLKIDVKEAKKILKTFFDKFPKIKKFRDDSINFAIENGYVEMICGRKRRLPDMQLDKYEMRIVSEGSNSDPLDGIDDILELDIDSIDARHIPIDEVFDPDIDDETFNEYWIALENAWGYKNKRAIIDSAREENGIEIIDNSKKIQEATRQVVNSRIQGSAGIITKNAMVKLNASKVIQLRNRRKDFYENLKKYVERSNRLKELKVKLILQVHDELPHRCPKINAKEGSELVKDIMIESAADLVPIPMKVDCDISYRWMGEEVKI